MGTVIIWPFAIVAFLGGRAVFSELASPATPIGALVYAYCLWQVILPFLKGENIDIPSIGEELVVGKNDVLRIVFFAACVLICGLLVVAP